MYTKLREKLSEKEYAIAELEDKELRRAFIHRSYLNEARNQGLESNERLEFLGDSVLQLAVSRYLFIKFPQEPEGKLTNYRSSIVKTQTLADVARELGMGEYLEMSRGELEGGGRENSSLLANTFEAFLGVLYLKSGFEECYRFINAFLLWRLDEIIKVGAHRDAKSLFQERVQERYKTSPVYRVKSDFGPDHNKTFEIEVLIGEQIWGVGVGKSKQEAEQKAARIALDRLSIDDII